MWLVLGWLAACTPDETGYGDTDDMPNLAADSAERGSDDDLDTETDDPERETDDAGSESDLPGTDTDTDTDTDDTACLDSGAPCDSGSGCGRNAETLKAHLTCDDDGTTRPWHVAWGDFVCVIPGGAVYDVVWFGNTRSGFRAYFDGAGQRDALEQYDDAPTFCGGTRSRRWWGVNLHACVPSATFDVCAQPVTP